MKRKKQMSENERYHRLTQFFKADAMQRCAESEDPCQAAILMLTMLPFVPPGSVFGDAVNDGLRQGCEAILNEKAVLQTN